MRATLRLFKALPVEVEGKKSPSLRLLKSTIKRGFVFSPEVLFNYPDYSRLIETVEEIYGITPEKMNASFHKSWAKVQNASIEQLVIEQWAHYLTTYGKEDPLAYAIEKGITYLPPDFEPEKLYDKDYVYIPEEALDIPDLNIGEMRLVVIKGYTKIELKEKLLKLLGSGIALKEDTIKDVIDVALYVGISVEDVEKIKNKEVRVILYEYLSLVPTNPVEFLRYAVYITTDETLLIKSKELIAKIKEQKGIKVLKYFKAYDTNNGLEKLAEIFYRFKPIFLAFRTNQSMKIMINRLRRLAIEYHKPMPEDYLNTITAKLKKNIPLYAPQLRNELDKVNIFRKIRLAYALKFRTKDAESILFRIRNGKSYATDFTFEDKKHAQRVLDIVIASIVKDVEKNVKGKNIYIPDYINYALPATEKQFTGNMPAGTYISTLQNMLVGVHWENIGSHRIDLDLASISNEGKFGWDGSYRSNDGEILFSGDITDAPKPKGATELFYVKRQCNNSFIITLNYFNYDETVKVPFKILVAEEDAQLFGGNYTVNPNNVLATVQTEIDKRQKILGLLVTTENGNKFYFIETAIGKSITSSNSEYIAHARRYLSTYYQNSIDFKDILFRAGANVVSESTIHRDKSNCNIDLSPESLEKDTIMNLLI